VTRASAPAKLNLALVVGPRRRDGKHALTTVFQRLDLADRVAVEPGSRLEVRGYGEDTLVRAALEALAEAAGVQPRWSVRLWKRIPVAAGLAGGSSDAATALRLANETLDAPLPPARLAKLAAAIGADVPFFLLPGPQLGEGDGTQLSPLDLPQDFWVLVVVPHGAAKASTGSIYVEFDERGGPLGYDERRAELLAALGAVRRPRDLAALPRNDLASSPLTARLEALGAFRADVTGAGPAVYGLFHHRAAAEAARRAIEPVGRAWITVPAWYG
jgi:4-diphosphocytidyl-2-C-methyl-D-erythritol kinase